LLRRYPSRMATPEPANAPSRAFIALTSPPAENARPAPVSTTQRTPSSAFTCSQTAATASPSPGAPSAFRLSGRFSVSRATGPRISRVNRLMALLPPAHLRVGERTSASGGRRQAGKAEGPPLPRGPSVAWPGLSLRVLLLLRLRGRDRARRLIAAPVRREHPRKGERQDRRVEAQLVHGASPCQR